MVGSETFQAAHENPPLWTFHALPYDVLTRAFRPSERAHATFVFLGILESALLLALYHVIGSRRIGTSATTALVASAIALAVIALSARDMSSSDVYAYAGYGKLGLQHAYAPEVGAMNANFRAIDGLWGNPMRPCFYGPLWVLVAQFAMAPVNSLSTAVFVWRVLGLAALVLVICLFTVKRFPVALLALTACNAGLNEIYVADAHNDILGIALVLASLVIVRKNAWLAAVFIACASLNWKLPFLAFSLIAFSQAISIQRRVGFIALTISMVVLASFAMSGMTYFNDLNVRFHFPPGEKPGLLSRGTLTHGLFVIAFMACLLGFIRRIYFGNGVSWSFIGLSTLRGYPWYVVWGLPYAALSQRSLSIYLIAFPAVACLMETKAPMEAMFVIYGVFAILQRIRGVVPDSNGLLAVGKRLIKNDVSSDRKTPL
jgi:hypothetical protein